MQHFHRFSKADIDKYARLVFNTPCIVLQLRSCCKEQHCQILEKGP